MVRYRETGLRPRGEPGDGLISRVMRAVLYTARSWGFGRPLECWRRINSTSSRRKLLVYRGVEALKFGATRAQKHSTPQKSTLLCGILDIPAPKSSLTFSKQARKQRFLLEHRH